jgi:HEAT repeat protein
MGLVALLEVLVTLGGEQALPLIEPFTQDENKWVRHYACRAKEYIQQGKVFLFAPYF